MSTKPRYCYSKLPSTRHTRLIRLHASDTDNYPIACELIEVNVDDKPAYQALSYTWDNETPSEPLEIVSRGGLSTTSLPVTKNCAEALKLLRKRVKPYSVSEIGLWVDAVCINQSSIEEKNAQVAMMAEIYENAQEVVVWLGNKHAPPNRRSMILIPLLQSFNEYTMLRFFRSWNPRWEKMLLSVLPIWVKIVERGMRFKSSCSKACNRDWHWLPMEPPTGIATGHKLTSLAASRESLPMLVAPYWDRAWTLQEFAHANARILCLNSKTFTCNGLGVAGGHFEANSNVHLHHRLLEMAQQGDEFAGTRPSLLSIVLPNVLDKECSNPRDRVYALRDLFHNVLGAMKVDYGRTVEDISVEATRLLILSSRDLMALYTACNSRKRCLTRGPTKKPYSMPSWAVDWTTGPDRGLLKDEEPWYALAIYYFGQVPDRLVLPALFSDDGLRLTLWGKQFSQVSDCVSDKLTYAGDPRADGRNFIKAVATLFSEAAETAFSKPESFGPSMAQILGAVYQGWSDICNDAIARMKAENDPQRVCELLKVECGPMSMLLRRRRFFITTDGKLAIGGADLCPGDWICTLAGLTVPFIVRPKASSYVLISPAIVDGAMNGEMWPDDEEEVVSWEII